MHPQNVSKSAEHQIITRKINEVHAKKGFNAILLNISSNYAPQDYRYLRVNMGIGKGKRRFAVGVSGRLKNPNFVNIGFKKLHKSILQLYTAK